MSLYPSLEDMQVDRTLQAQDRAQQPTAPVQSGPPPTYPAYPPANHSTPYPSLSQSGGLYPALNDAYMGLSLRQTDLPPNVGAIIPAQNSNRTVAIPNQSRQVALAAPVSGTNNLGVLRSEIKNGLRMVTICHDLKGKFGLKLKSIDDGIFVCLVADGSPAAMVGIRFGDQIVQINGQNCAGLSTDKALSKLKKSDPLKCEVRSYSNVLHFFKLVSNSFNIIKNKLVIRDRPFERTVTMQKDSTGHVGFLYKNGKITDLVKDSSAARNGLLTDHQMCEINGQNVVGMKDKHIGEVLKSAGSTLTITVMPEFIYDHIVKKVSKGLFKQMDHSIPDV